MSTLFNLLLVVLLSFALLTVLIRILQRKRTKITFAIYWSELKSFQLPTEGHVEYAQWLHPSEGHKKIKQEDVDELRRFIKKGDMVIDIGPHTGDTTVPMALAAGASGCTLGLEPNPYVFKILEQNASLIKEKTNITPSISRRRTPTVPLRSTTPIAPTATAGFSRRSKIKPMGIVTRSKCRDAISISCFSLSA